MRLLTIEHLLQELDVERRPAVLGFHRAWRSDFDKAAGSGGAHQAWPGGYRDHLTHCFELACDLYPSLSRRYGGLPFPLSSALLVLYFHDIEKMWKYAGGLPPDFDKTVFLFETLPGIGIVFTQQERNALRYVHGEGDDYLKGRRVMNELAGFCHAIDVLSARTLWDRKGELFDGSFHFAGREPLDAVSVGATARRD